MFLKAPAALVLTALACCAGGDERAEPATALPDSGVPADAPSCIAPPPRTAPADCTGPLRPGDDVTCSIEIAGRERQFLLFAPSTYDPCKPVALVVDAHGTDETASMQAGLDRFLVWPTGLGSGFRLVAEREGFLVVTPQGIDNRWTPDDVELIRAIPAAVETHATLDTARLFLTGISNGAALTYWTSCTGASPYRGYGPVSGYSEDPCVPPAGARIVQFQSPEDSVADPALARAQLTSWTDANHCTKGAPLVLGAADSGALCVEEGSPWALASCAASAPATTCEQWLDCDGGGKAWFCTVPPDNSYDLGFSGGHILYFNNTRLSLAAVAWRAWTTW